MLKLAELFGHEEAPWPWNGRWDLLEGQLRECIAGGSSVVYVRDGVAGMASYIPHPGDGETAVLANLSVRPADQRTGVGRDLVEAVRSLAHGRGFKRLTAMIWTGGKLGFYDKVMDRVGVVFVKET
jgi:GNAT superfamily N-acetyltransferase